MNHSSAIGLINNAALLLALCLLYDMLGLKLHERKTLIQQILTGIVLGAIGLAIMFNPWNFGQGVVFDTRSVLLVISGFFFGTIPVVLAVMMTGFFRFVTGGAGVWTGLAVIVTSGALGLLWRHYRPNRNQQPSIGELYLLGIVVHLLMLGWFFLLPWQFAIDVLSKISFPVMFIYPIATAILGNLMVMSEKRRRYEEKLRESEERYRELVENANSIIMRMDRNGRVTFINEYAQSFFGYRASEIIGKSVVGTIVPEKDSAGIDLQAMIMDIGAHPQLYVSNENENMRRDGSRLRIAWTNKPFFNELGEVSEILCVGNDITERRKAEDLAKEATIKMQEVVRATRVGLWDWILDTNKVHFSTEWKRQIGYEEHELIDDFTEWESRVHPDDLVQTLAKIREAIDVPRPDCQVEFRFRHKDGSYRWILALISVLIGDNGKATRLLGTHIDITERKQAEKDLRHSYELMSYIIKHNTSALAVHDKALNYLFVSERYLQDYKVKEKNIIGKHHYDVFPDLPQKWRDVHQKALSGITSSAENDRYDREDGSIEWTTWECRPWYQGNGEIGGFVVYTEVVTDKIKSAEQKLLLQKQLSQAQKMEAIGVLAGGIAHDFNNILGAILGYAEMVQDDCPIGSRMRNDIDRVVEASHRAKELVKQILAFSRQTDTEEKPLQPTLIIKEAVKMLRPSLPSTIDIQQNIDPDVGLIFADPTQIHQILTNLCTNAFHAMEETGGILTISLKNKELHLSDLVSEPDVQPGLFVDISVADTGPGISPQIVDKIFDPFFTTKEVGRGTGMGLAIIHGIAKKSGGVVSFQSSPGEGTIFHVYMPVYISTSTLTDEIPPIELIQPGIERILFIDDEKMLAEMGKTMLERLGYKVTMATSSIEALKTIQNQQENFDLVITDQTMPDMTGIDLARRILQIRPGMPIILCTGFSNLISEEKARIYGIKGFAMKPLAKKDLAALIRTVLDEQKRYT